MGFDDADRTAKLKFDGKKIIINKEDFKMEEMLRELKEDLLNKEMTLLDLDNNCQVILDTDDSIYKSDYLEHALCDDTGVEDYYTVVNGETVAFRVEFDILSEDWEQKMIEDKENDYADNIFKILVKATNIYIL